MKYGMPTFVDVHGRSKTKIVPIAHFGQMFEASELFTGAALDGVPQEVNDDEVASRPDPSSAIVLPWRKDTAWFASDLELSGEPFEACSRQILKRAVSRAANMGFAFNLGIETEFFVFREGGDRSVHAPETIQKPAYDVRHVLHTLPFLSELVTAMNDLGWDVYSFDQEDAPGQFETDFGYADVLTMSDRFTFFRLMANEIAARHGCFVSFMPKPFGHMTGSGGHFNMSLADVKSGHNLFETKQDPKACGLSELGYQFAAGVLRHAAAICAVIAPTVNSYKRLVAKGSMSGFTWAPIFVSYGNNNRTNMLRIPLSGGRIECRAADIACNPYLAAAMILTAGLEGIEEGLDPGRPHRENMYLKSEEELRTEGIGRLPRSLGEAVDAFAADDLGRKVMGETMFKAFKELKGNEWAEYHSHVSDWEIDRYLRFL